MQTLDELGTLPDADVVRLAQQGRELAFRELVRRYERPVFSLVFRMVRDRETAEDLAQDAFVKILNHIDKYSPEFKFSSWLFKIANNVAIDHLRRRRLDTISMDGSLHASTASEVEAQVMASMHEDFAVTPVRLLQRAPDTAGLESVWSAGRPRCGHFAEHQRAALFGAEATELRSMAIIPLGAGATRGVLVLGSSDADRFNPGVSTDFLVRIGELVAAALARCGVEPAV